MRFSIENVGENAGKVWKALNENGKMSIKKLEESTELKKDDINFALGWLLKEGKVDSAKVGRTINFFLV